MEQIYTIHLKYRDNIRIEIKNAKSYIIIKDSDNDTTDTISDCCTLISRISLYKALLNKDNNIKKFIIFKTEENEQAISTDGLLSISIEKVK